MKNTLRLLLIAVALVTPDIGYADDSSDPQIVTTRHTFADKNREWFVFVSTGLQDPMRKKIKSRLIQLIGTEAAVGDVFHLFETPSHRPVLSIVIPEGSPSTRLRTKAMRKQIAKLVPLFDKPPKNGSLALNIPAVPASIAAVRRTPFPALVVLCGDPSYSGANFHRGWSMGDYLIPTDAAIVKSPGSHLSPYWQGVIDMPPHSMVNLLSHDSDFGADHIFRHDADRCWRLFFQEHGGSHFLKITASVDSAFDLLRPQVLPSKVEPIVGEAGMRIASIQSAQDTDGENPLVVFIGHPRNKPAIYKVVPPEGTDEIFAKAMTSMTHTLWALRWAPDASLQTLTDTDLSLISRRTGEQLSFKKPKTSFGRLYSDVRYGEGNGERDLFGENWEIVAVRNDAPPLDAWVNIYCAVGPIRAQLVQIRKGVRTEKTFTIPCLYGDERENTGQRSKSKAWYRLPFPLASGRVAAMPKNPR